MYGVQRRITRQMMENLQPDGVVSTHIPRALRSEYIVDNDLYGSERGTPHARDTRHDVVWAVALVGCACPFCVLCQCGFCRSSNILTNVTKTIYTI